MSENENFFLSFTNFISGIYIKKIDNSNSAKLFHRTWLQKQNAKCTRIESLSDRKKGSSSLIPMDLFLFIFFIRIQALGIKQNLILAFFCFFCLLVCLFKLITTSNRCLFLRCRWFYRLWHKQQWKGQLTGIWKKAAWPKRYVLIVINVFKWRFFKISLGWVHSHFLELDFFVKGLGVYHQNIFLTMIRNTLYLLNVSHTKFQSRHRRGG